MKYCTDEVDNIIVDVPKHGGIVFKNDKLVTFTGTYTDAQILCFGDIKNNKKYKITCSVFISTV